MKSDRASSTARLIAMATLMWPELAPPGAAPFTEQLLQDRPRLLALCRSRLWRRLALLLEKIALPGAVHHWLARKREIDRLVRAAHAEGFTQLLVIGAGLDTLALRLADEGLFQRVISADHPATLEGLPAVESRVKRVPLDLASPVPWPATSPEPTIVVIEGVLMYLPPPAVEDVPRRLAALPVPRMRLVFSWMLETPGRPIGFREQSPLVTAWLRWRGEPMLWATTHDHLAALLPACGWTAPAFQRFALESEQLVIAERVSPCP